MAKPLLTHLVNTQRSLSQVFLSCPNVPLCLLFLIASSSCSGEISYSNNSYNYLISLTSSLKILVKGLDTTTHSNWCFFWQSSGKVIPQNLSKIHRSQAPSVAIIFFTIVKYFNILKPQQLTDWIDLCSFPWNSGAELHRCTPCMSSPPLLFVWFESCSLEPHSMHFSSPTGTNNTQSILIGFTQCLSRLCQVFSRLKNPSLFSCLCSPPLPLNLF